MATSYRAGALWARGRDGSPRFRGVQAAKRGTCSHRADGTRPEREALARANLYAALSTTGVGTQKSFVTRERFEAEWRRRAAGAALAP
jgi:sugar/nucleoside kinase (ribokinase family)